MVGFSRSMRPKYASVTSSGDRSRRRIAAASCAIVAWVTSAACIVVSLSWFPRYRRGASATYAKNLSPGSSPRWLSIAAGSGCGPGFATLIPAPRAWLHIDSIHCGCLDRDDEVWRGEAGDAEQGGGEAHAGGLEAPVHYGEVLWQGVHVGRIEVEPHHVGEGHAGAGEDRFEVVEGESELGGHVARMLCVAVGVNGVLGAADEFSAVPLDELRLIEAQLHRPRRRVDGGSFHMRYPSVRVSVR